MTTDGEPVQDWCGYCYHMIECGAPGEWYHFSTDDCRDTWVDDDGQTRRSPYGCNCVYAGVNCHPSVPNSVMTYSGYNLRLHLSEARAYLVNTMTARPSVLSRMEGYRADSVIIDEVGRL